MHKSPFRCLKVDISLSKYMALGTLNESGGITGRIIAIFEHGKRIIEKVLLAYIYARYFLIMVIRIPIPHLVPRNQNTPILY